jgi:RNA polymerase sigma factor (sigma-70 family)
MSTPASYDDDEKLLNDLMQGKSDILIVLRRQYFAMVLDFVRQRGGTHQQAEDLYEESIIALYHYTRKPGFSLRSKLSTLLYGIARNIYSNNLAKGKGRSGVILEDMTPLVVDTESDIEAALARKEQLEYFHSVLVQLDEDCRRLLILAILEELPAAEIMALMNFSSASYLYKRKSICKDRLLTLFAKDGNLDQYG